MPAGFTETIQRGATELGIALEPDQLEQLTGYLDLLIKWNSAYNLTAVKRPEEMIIKHLFDSFSVHPYLRETDLIDVGSGAGLPGIPLAILNPALPVRSLDSNSKKTRFQQQVKIELGLKNFEVIHDRVESIEGQVFDQVISRAFASVADMVRLCHKLLSSEGIFLAMKGRYPDEELADLPAGYQLMQSYALQVPDLNEERHLLLLGRG